MWFAGVDNLITVTSALESRIDKLESHVKVLAEKCGVASPIVPSGTSVAKTLPAAPAVKPEEVDEDDNVDLFGSDSEVCLMCKLIDFHKLAFKRKNFHISLFNSDVL